MAKKEKVFIRLVKIGERPIDVHPSVVEDHKRLGWKEADPAPDREPEAEPETETPAEAETKKGK